MQATEIATVLAAYARLTNSPRVDYYQVLDYMKKLAERRGDPGLQRMVKNHIPEFVQVLNDLERQGLVSLIRDGGMVSGIEVPSYYSDTLRKIYKTIAESATVPFPDKDTLKMDFAPANMLVTDVKQDFATILAKEGKLEHEIVRVNFPDGISHLLAPADVVGPKIVEMSVAKMSLYLQDQRNLSYVSSKMRSILAGSEIALNNALNDIVGRSGRAVQTLLEPSDFSLKFWTHLASLVLQDLTKKKDKSRDDHGYCQACYVIGHWVVHQRGVQQREQERATDLKRLDTALKKPPYAFTLDEILSLADPKGVAFVRKHSRQFVLDFLQSRTEASDAGKLPAVVRVRGPGNREYFVPREFIAPLFVSKAHEAAAELRKQYLAMAVDATRAGERRGPLFDDQAFAADLKSRILESYPLLQALLNPDLLYLGRDEIEADSTVKGEVDGCFVAPRKLRPVNQIMRLDRKKMLKDVRAMLPPWYTMPVLKQIFFMLRRLFAGGRKKASAVAAEGDWVDELAPDGKAATGKQPVAEAEQVGAKEISGLREASTAAYRASVHALVKEFVGSEKQIDGTLEELEAKWNPLFDPDAKRNLVADVDSFIRDFVRSLRKGFRVKPPDATRIRALADELSQKQALAQIRKKEHLKKYIEIYMVRLLLKK